MENKKLKEGEKYLSLSIGGMKLALFPNKDKKSQHSPDFVGSISIGCWVNKKKPQQQTGPEVEDVL